jgi:hypothetical protein
MNRMLLTRVIEQKSRNECLDAMLHESGRKSSDAMHSYNFLLLTRSLFAGQSGMKQEN